MVALDLPTQDLVRLVLSDLQDRQISLSRMTEIWPKRNATNEELGPTKIIVVLQSEKVQEAALIFHQNEKILSILLEEPKAALPRAPTRVAPQR